MFSLKFVSLFSLLTLMMIQQTISTSNSLVSWCPNTTMFANNSDFEENLNNLFRNLTLNATNNPTGFYQMKVGNPTSEPIYGQYMCRGDQNSSSCNVCVTTATNRDLPTDYCPNRKNAIIWYDECMVRYANESFFNQMVLSPGYILWNTRSILGNASRFDEILTSMMNNVTIRAAKGDSSMKFATANASVNEPVPQTIYGLGQCTPDLIASDCSECLRFAYSEMNNDSMGGRYLGPSCIVRYETYDFFNLSSSSPQPPMPITPLIVSPGDDAKHYLKRVCVGNGNAASVYEQNLEVLLHNLSSASSALKFYNYTAGDSPNKAYGLYQCRHDLNTTVCGDCVNDAMRILQIMCPSYKEAIVWYMDCMLRFANRSFFSLSETEPGFSFNNTASPVTNDSSKLNSVLQLLTNTLITDPAFNSPKSGYFTSSEANLSTSIQLFGFAQCTLDLDPPGCRSCLEIAASLLTSPENTDLSKAQYLPSCQIMYGLTPFILKAEKPTPSPPPSRKAPMVLRTVIGVLIGGLVGVALFSGGIWWCLHGNKEEALLIGLYDDEPHDGSRFESVQFDLKTIKAATNNFSVRNKLGQGGFGEVYKGNLESGQEIAVKRLSENSQQGILEFKNEVLLVAKLQHKNLVKLLGFCVTRKEQILVYEFLPNLSLDHFIRDKVKRASLNWEVRFRIINGVARGLLYLHEDSRLTIIHRDLKSSNILLDEAMNAKIADFGLAKLFAIDQTQGDTVKIAGTYGYMAPEYSMAGHFSVKSDVYSFGVIILELVSGQRNNFFNRHQDEEGLLKRAWRLWNEVAEMELVDPVLGDNFSAEEVKLCINIGLLCIQEDPTDRPRMASIVTAFNGQSITLPKPNAPHFFTLRNQENVASSSSSDLQKNLAEGSDSKAGTLSISNLSPR